MVVAAAKANNMLVSSGNDLPGGNQSGSINKNYEQSADSNSLPKLGEVSNVSYQNLIPKFVWKRNPNLSRPNHEYKNLFSFIESIEFLLKVQKW